MAAGLQHAQVVSRAGSTCGGCEGISGTAEGRGDSIGPGSGAAVRAFEGVFRLSSRMLFKSKLSSVTVAALTSSRSLLAGAAHGNIKLVRVICQMQAKHQCELQYAPMLILHLILPLLNDLLHFWKALANGACINNKHRLSSGRAKMPKMSQTHLSTYKYCILCPSETSTQSYVREGQQCCRRSPGCLTR